LLDEALEDFPFPEEFTEAQIAQLREAIVIPENASMEQIQEALNRLADQLPAEAPTLEEMSTLLNNALDGLDIASPEDVRTALAEFNFSEAQIAQIINALPEGLNKVDLADALEGVVVGEDLDAAVTTITDLIGNLKIASPDDVRDILANYGFTDAQLQQIAGAITIPPSATVADIERIISNIPPGLSVDEITNALGSEFDALTEGISGVQAGVDDLAEQLGLTSDELINAINVLSTKSSEELTDTERNILNGLSGLATSFNTDLSTVVNSISGLSTDVVDGISGLSGQLTGVQTGIDDLANQLGLTSEELINAINDLSVKTSDQLTDLDTSIINGLSGLATSFNTDIAGVVTSITGLGTDVASGISGISSQISGLETAVTTGIEDLADQLNVSTDDIVSAVISIGSGLGGELTDLETSVLMGLTELAASLGTNTEDLIGSISGVEAGVAEGFEDISGQLGLLGLLTLGLGAKQPTAQEIAAAQDQFKFTPFEEKASPRQVQQVVQAAPVKQQPSALQQINQLIDRQSTTPQIQPINQGMFTGDPNRKLA
jgi:hypothetical protein